MPQYLIILKKNVKKGWNNDYLCYLIRNDKIELFVRFINQNLIEPTSSISPSIFEINQLHIENQGKNDFNWIFFIFWSLQIF